MSIHESVNSWSIRVFKREIWLHMFKDMGSGEIGIQVKIFGGKRTRGFFLKHPCRHEHIRGH